MNNLLKKLISEKKIVKDESYKNLSKKFLNKARQNLVTMNLLYQINNDKFRDKLELSKDYDSNEWVVVTGYYAMYSAALSLISQLGYKSKVHIGTILLLEECLVKKNLLDSQIYYLLKNAMLKKEELNKITEARNKREIAQYSVTKKTTKDIASEIKKDAYNFVNKCEEILSLLI